MKKFLLIALASIVVLNVSGGERFYSVNSQTVSGTNTTCVIPNSSEYPIYLRTVLCYSSYATPTNEVTLSLISGSTTNLLVSGGQTNESTLILSPPMVYLLSAESIIVELTDTNGTKTIRTNLSTDF